MPAEPEKYSIDEMMERLKNHPPEDSNEEGELVTRADGTQAVRVRKRKRRSHQPHKEQERIQRRTRMIQVSSFLFLLILLGSTIGSLLVYTNSAPFRQSVLQILSDSSGAKVVLESFRVSLTRANAGQVVLTWPEGKSTQELQMQGVTAAVSPSSFFGKSLSGEEVSIMDASLRLAVPKETPADSSKQTIEGSSPVQFDRYAVAKLQLLYGDASMPSVQMRNSEAMFQTASEISRARLLLNQGEISIRGWQKLRIDRSQIEFRGSEIDLINMRLLHEEDNRGFLDLSGTISSIQAGSTSSLELGLDNFLLSGIAGSDLGALVSGRVQTLDTPDSNRLTFTPDSANPISLSASFISSPSQKIEVQGFPFLASIARLMDDEWFERPVFDMDATGMIIRKEQNIALENLNLINKERMILRGNVRVSADQRLSGNLKVGISEAMVQSAFNRRIDAMAGPAKDGFRWIDLTLGGHLKNPSDNFLVLLENSKLKPKPSTTEPTGTPSFDELLAPK